jgi:hypothetical protein
MSGAVKTAFRRVRERRGSERDPRSDLASPPGAGRRRVVRRIETWDAVAHLGFVLLTLVVFGLLAAAARGAEKL